MASGKSLELAQIKPLPGQAKCLCGEPYSSHMRKDGKGVLKKFDTPEHSPMVALVYASRRQRRAFDRNPKKMEG